MALTLVAGMACSMPFTAANANERWDPAPGNTWWWQIENTERVNINRAVDVFDIDLFDGDESLKISNLNDKGKLVICYFSAGTYEPWRPDAFAFTAGALISGASLPQFDEETWLDIGNPTALRDVIRPIMRDRLNLARDVGCDAVEPDNVDGYDNEETNGQISARDQFLYNRWLAGAAHARGLSVGLKNDLGQLRQLVKYFDFAVNEQCFAYDNECVLYESTFLAAGKPVFNQEYGGSASEGGLSRTEYIRDACSYFRSQGISSLWKQTLNLDGRGVVQCSP